jgi:hypothetical protein
MVAGSMELIQLKIPARAGMLIVEPSILNALPNSALPLTLTEVTLDILV